MKQTVEQSLFVRDRAVDLERDLLRLERRELDIEAEFNELLARAAEICTRTRHGLPYFRERAERLRELLSRARDDRARVRETYPALYRQLERLGDEGLRDALDPLERPGAGFGGASPRGAAARSAAQSVVARSGPNTLLVYALGPMIFGLPGPILHRSGFKRPRARAQFRGHVIDCFPEPGSALFPRDLKRARLLIVQGKRTVGYWCEKEILIRRMPGRDPLSALEPMEREHRRIAGRLRMRGSWINVLRPE